MRVRTWRRCLGRGMARERPSLERPPNWRAPEPWFDVRWLWASRTNREALRAELDREIAEGHALAGFIAEVIAKCEHCDDVAIVLRDETFAIVHLTWSRGPEKPPWPRWIACPTAADVIQEMTTHLE
jgi:hypothetical protein